MATASSPSPVAQQARKLYVEHLLRGLEPTIQAVREGVIQLSGQLADPKLAVQRQATASALHQNGGSWTQSIAASLREVLANDGRTTVVPIEVPVNSEGELDFDIVDDATVEHEILISRMALALVDLSSWEYNDLRSRINMLESREDLDNNDLFRPLVFARMVATAWRDAGLDSECWKAAQTPLHNEFAKLVESGFRAVNELLIQSNVMPEIDLRSMIRREFTANRTVKLNPVTGAPAVEPPPPGAMVNVGAYIPMTTSLSHLAEQAEKLIGRLTDLVYQHVPNFPAPHQPQPSQADALAAHLPLSASNIQQGLSRLMEELQQKQAAPASVTNAQESSPVAASEEEYIPSQQSLLDELQRRKRLLKQATTNPAERATIEIVALLFQSILTDERIPASVRVWFARLQMPVLRVAMAEPEFFAEMDHPARRLIDRMGGCVMGFDTGSRSVGELLQKEIKRIAQVVEAYPDTGRRVFQTVLTEFESFLEHYFKNENEASRGGVSLAQQIEQRETLTIQYTIELRKRLNEVPVQEGVRDFLFNVWADVLAMSALQSGKQGPDVKTMKRAAADLIWSASAKISREERGEVLRRLPTLLKTIREGMLIAGITADKQEAHIRTLNNLLAAAFTSKAAVIPHERLEALMNQLESIEELLPDSHDSDIDESIVLDLSGHESEELEVVGAGGSMPTPAMLAWAAELQVGGWFMLDYRDRNEAVQLAWHGMRKQLILFVSPRGRGVLFQRHRLAAFLQAGLLVPAEDEKLTVKATRDALKKLDGDPSRLLQ
jgi:hypothetical protein